LLLLFIVVYMVCFVELENPVQHIEVNNTFIQPRLLSYSVKLSLSALSQRHVDLVS